jgi:hypothetical protein
MKPTRAPAFTKTKPINLLEVVDELNRIGSLFDGAFLILVEGYTDEKSTNAAHEIMAAAMQRFAVVTGAIYDDIRKS